MEKNGLSIHDKTVVIGGSAGSLDALFKILPLVHDKIPFSIIIVLHRRSAGDSSLVELLASKTKIPVSEVEDKDPICINHIYLAPSDYHLLIEKDRTFTLDYSEKVNFSRPSLDVTFESAAEVYKEALTGIILSGANEDGTRGLQHVKKLGGTVLAQKPETAQIPIMPQNAIDSGCVNLILEIQTIAEFLNQFG